MCLFSTMVLYHCMISSRGWSVLQSVNLWMLEERLLCNLCSCRTATNYIPVYIYSAMEVILQYILQYSAISKRKGVLCYQLVMNRVRRLLDIIFPWQIALLHKKHVNTVKQYLFLLLKFIFVFRPHTHTLVQHFFWSRCVLKKGKARKKKSWSWRYYTIWYIPDQSFKYGLIYIYPPVKEKETDNTFNAITQKKTGKNIKTKFLTVFVHTHTPC